MFWRRRSSELVPKDVRHALSDLFSGHEMNRLAKRGTLVDFDTGETIATQGTRAHDVLIIALGTATVTRDGDEISTVGPGDVVGEISVLTGNSRSATIVADEPVTGYLVSRRHFGFLLEECPDAAATVWPETIRRVHKLNAA